MTAKQKARIATYARKVWKEKWPELIKKMIDDENKKSATEEAR